jgi:hypothetical protein
MKQLLSPRSRVKGLGFRVEGSCSSGKKSFVGFLE